MDTLIIWVLVYFVLASQFYIFDKKGKFFLRDIYLFFYNLGHREEITYEQVTQGFVYNQSVGKRLTVALIFDIVLSILFWKVNVLDTGIKILLMFIGTPIIFMGFWFGGVIMEMIKKVFKKTVKTIDDIETGKLDPVEHIQQSYQEAKKDFKRTENTDEKPHQEEKTANSGIEKEIRSEHQKTDDEALAALRAFQRGNRNVK